MSRRRCFLRCEKNKTSLFGLPKDEDRRNQWLEFVFATVPEEYNPNLLLCSLHFTEDCFTNWVQFDQGFSQRLFLTEWAVPTLFGPHSHLKPTTQSSVQEPISRFKNMACQTDPPRTCTVGTQYEVPSKNTSVATQLSKDTLKETHVRSKSTQSGETSDTDNQVCTSTTADQSSEPKRPRLEETPTDFRPEFYDSTYNPDYSEVKNEQDEWSRSVDYSYHTQAKAKEAEDDQNGVSEDKDIKDEDPPDSFLVTVKEEEETEEYC